MNMLLRDLLDLAALLDQYAAFCRRRGDGRGADQAGNVWIAVAGDVKRLEHTTVKPGEQMRASLENQ